MSIIIQNVHLGTKVHIKLNSNSFQKNNNKAENIFVCGRSRTQMMLVVWTKSVRRIDVVNVQIYIYSRIQIYNQDHMADLVPSAEGFFKNQKHFQQQFVLFLNLKQTDWNKLQTYKRLIKKNCKNKMLVLIGQRKRYIFLWQPHFSKATTRQVNDDEWKLLVPIQLTVLACLELPKNQQPKVEALKHQQLKQDKQTFFIYHCLPVGLLLWKRGVAMKMCMLLWKWGSPQIFAHVLGCTIKIGVPFYPHKTLPEYKKFSVQETGFPSKQES